MGADDDRCIICGRDENGSMILIALLLVGIIMGVGGFLIGAAFL